ncbi:hypothetical protein [Streptomyces sp. NPDC001604]|uniref:hypothetical protein n=1 Tax=Streptomyces sp. NPDC001604 TaxID=3364593 RepID=UPI0036A0D03D
MGSLRLTLCTGALAVCALAPPVYAVDAGGAGISVSPSSPAPGADVALHVAGCSAKAGSASSRAFVADVRLAGVDGTLTGNSRVRASAEPGSYDVKVTCGGAVTTGRITVVSPSPSPSPSKSQPASHPAESPVAPVHAGGGGTAHFATVDVREAGPGTGQAVTGLVLVAAAAGAVAVLSARRSRGTD